MTQSAQQVVHELTQAGLLSSDEVTQFNTEIKVGVDALLKRLVEQRRITQYQADKFQSGDGGDICFGEYLVMEELGRGGMGTVLLAKHRRMDRKVAIKVLPVTVLESEAAIARFYQEVKVAAQLSHPNIVHAYDAGEHHGFHYLVMEYVPGHDLARVLEQLGSLPTSLVLDYIRQAAAGLEYAHRKGVVHRDIKPANLLLDDEGAVKILDMGLARIGGISRSEHSLHLTATGQVMGTVEYMSPEQAEDTRSADHRSDIYSLGCTLFRLTTGQSPFARDTVVKTILAHREAPAPSIDVSHDPDAHNLNPIFQRMVAKQPRDRYQNITDLMQDIRLLEGNLTSTVTADKLGRDHSPAATRYMPSAAEPAEPPVEANLVNSLNKTAVKSIPEINWPGITYVRPHRGSTLLAMGVLSVLTFYCVGLILGAITWGYASHDLQEMKQGTRDERGKTQTQVAQLLALASIVLFVLTMISWPIFSWGSNFFWF